MDDPASPSNSRDSDDKQLLGWVSQIFAAQSLLHIFPTEKKLAEFVTQSLRAIPVIKQCGMCIRTLGENAGDILSPTCNDCPDTRLTETVVHYRCAFPAMERTELIPLTTQTRSYGHLQIAMTDVQAFAPLKPFIANLANSIALTLENRWHREHLEKLNKELQTTCRELSNNENLFRTLAQNAPVGIFRSDPAGADIYVNQRWCNMTGQTAKEALGASWTRTIHPDDREKVFHLWERALQTKGTFHAEHRIETPNGKIGWVLAQAAPEMDAGGGILGWVGTLIDISDHKKIEDALLEVDRLKSEFLSMAAHELRTPLTSIRGYSELLARRDYTDLGKIKHFADVINSESEHLAAIVDDLMDVARIETGRSFVLNATRVDLRQLVQTETHAFTEQCKQHSFETTLPKATAPCQADKEKISQVIKNLLSNAVKYSPAGRRIAVSLDTMETYYQISVKDDGIGLSQEQIEKLFQKFYRADPSGTIKGTGLGLFIVKRIINLHSGGIWVDSTLGKGTCVSFTLPRYYA